MSSWDIIVRKCDLGNNVEIRNLEKRLKARDTARQQLVQIKEKKCLEKKLLEKEFKEHEIRNLYYEKVKNAEMEQTLQKLKEKEILSRILSMQIRNKLEKKIDNEKQKLIERELLQRLIQKEGKEKELENCIKLQQKKSEKEDIAAFLASIKNSKEVKKLIERNENEKILTYQKKKEQEKIRYDKIIIQKQKEKEKLTKILSEQLLEKRERDLNFYELWIAVGEEELRLANEKCEEQKKLCAFNHKKELQTMFNLQLQLKNFHKMKLKEEEHYLQQEMQNKIEEETKMSQFNDEQRKLTQQKIKNEMETLLEEKKKQKEEAKLLSKKEFELFEKERQICNAIIDEKKKYLLLSYK